MGIQIPMNGLMTNLQCGRFIPILTVAHIKSPLETKKWKKLDNNDITILAGLYCSTFWGFAVYQIMFYVKQISPRPGDPHNPRYQGTVLRVHQPRGNGLLHLMGI